MFYFISLFCFVLHSAVAFEPSDKTLDVEVMPDDGSQQIHLTWTHHPDTTTYRVFRRDKGTDSWNPLSTKDGEISDFIDTNIELGRQYEYRVEREVSGIGTVGTYVMAGHSVVPTAFPGLVLAVVYFFEKVAGDLGFLING